MTLESLNFIEAVTERDIDLLLLEEFHASEEFCDFEEDRDLSDSYSHRLALKQFEKLFIRQSGLTHNALHDMFRQIKALVIRNCDSSRLRGMFHLNV